ncbi:MAG: hypothetical protein LBQ66_16395 [Planctomycetaceae bacterium]|nr:hypothetical protein [Planctomycetaceae bacterium]
MVLPMRVPPHCFRLAPLAENTTAQRSVAHLTINLCGIARHPARVPVHAASRQTHRQRNRSAVGYLPHVTNT